MENYSQFLLFFILASVVGIVSIAVALSWVLHYREGLGWDGGAAEFNWHPLLMVIGFIFLQGIGKELGVCVCLGSLRFHIPEITIQSNRSRS